MVKFHFRFISRRSLNVFPSVRKYAETLSYWNIKIIITAARCRRMDFKLLVSTQLVDLEKNKNLFIISPTPSSTHRDVQILFNTSNIYSYMISLVYKIIYSKLDIFWLNFAAECSINKFQSHSTSHKIFFGTSKNSVIVIIHRYCHRYKLS